MYWILGGLAYIFGVVLIIRWLDKKLGDPRWHEVRALFIAHRRHAGKRFRRAF